MEILAVIVGVLLFLVAMLRANTDNTPVPKKATPEEIRVFLDKLHKDAEDNLRACGYPVGTTVTDDYTVVLPADPDDISLPEMKNIAKCDNPLEWFVCTHKDLPAPSPAETLIIGALNLYRVRWYREVSFSGLQVNTYSYPRYDIMILVPYTPTGIHIIEYDSKLYHSSPQQIAMDKLKDRFCHKHHIPITRYSSKYYYKLHEEIAVLMKQYKIQAK